VKERDRCHRTNLWCFKLDSVGPAQDFSESVVRTVVNLWGNSWLFERLILSLPIPVAARSKVWVCGRSLTRIVGSNLTGGMDVCLLLVLCVVRYRSLRRADRLSRGVLPTLVCLKSVIVKPRKMRRPRPPRGCRATGGKNIVTKESPTWS
jgi:hypothetical protein